MATGAESKEPLEVICDRFEAEWQAGRRPAIESCLLGLPENSGPALLRELLFVELSHRRRVGERPSAQEYQQRFPEAAHLVEEVFSAHSAAGAGDGEAAALIGRSLSHFKIIRHLGSGGMGQVYVAEDTRLDRKVAVKLLPREVTRDTEAVGRFEREARAASALNHPNICTIYDIGEVEGQPFLVMELLEGQTLKERIGARPLKLEEILQLGIQIADALDAAHSRRIIHRDLKSTNLFVTNRGDAKILDFGLAKLMPERHTDQSADPHASTRTGGHEEQLTSPGIVVGTLPYMSPEQARGEPVDAATDIWAFGCILYEMVTGVKAFGGSSAQEILVKILDREPDWQALPNSTPHGLRRLIRRCLQKERRTRLRDIGDARIELEEIAGASGDAAAVQEARRSPKTRALAVVAACVLVAVLSLLIGSRLGTLVGSRPEDPAPVEDVRVARFTVDMPKDINLGIAAGFNPDLALSPDGTRLAFTPIFGKGAVVVRRLDGLDNQYLEAALDGGFGGGPMFSPDGKSLAFILGNAIFSQKRPFLKAALSGGAGEPLADYDMFHEGDWGADGYLYWTAHYPGGIVRIRDARGVADKVEEVTQLDVAGGERSHRFAKLLPGGKALIYTVAFEGIKTYDDARIDLWNLESRTKKTLIYGGTAAAYSPSGHIVARAGKLYAVGFDADALEVTGSPFEVLDGVLMSRNTGAAQFSLSEKGDLAYVPGAAEGGRRSLVWVDRGGKEEPLKLQTDPAAYLYPRISPDGRYIAYEIEGPNHDFYIYDSKRGVASKISTDGLSHAPVWSPDGKDLVFRSSRSGGMTMWRMPANRSAEPVCLDPKGTRQSAVSFSPDGRFITFDQNDPGTEGGDVWVLPLEGESQPQPIARSKHAEGSAKFSPDGRWIAYCSDESLSSQVYVQRFPLPGHKDQISTDGGSDPVWGRRSKELYYRNGDKMMAVTVDTSGEEFIASAPKLLWERAYSAGAISSCGMPGISSANYDVTPDGERFLMVRNDDNATFGKNIVVVLNWAKELKAMEAARSD